MTDKKQRRLRGKSPETLLSEAIEDLNRYEHETPVDVLKVQAAKTRIIALGKRVTAKQKNKKADKIATLLKTLEDKVAALEDKVAALTTEVEGLKQRLAGPLVPQADPAVATLAKMMADSTDASVDNSTGSPTLERMRRGEQVGGGLPRVPDIYPTLPKSVPPTPPRVKPVESQPVPPAPAPDTLDAKVARIQEESRRNAPAPSKVAAYEATEKLLADLQRATSDGYQQTLAVEAVFPAKSAEEQAAMDLMEKRYGDNPEANAARKKKNPGIKCCCTEGEGTTSRPDIPWGQRD